MFFWQLVTARAGAEWGERSVCATELLPLEQSVRALGPQLRYVAPGTRLRPCRAAGGRNFSPEPSPLLVALFWPRWRVDRGGGVGGRSAATPPGSAGRTVAAVRHLVGEQPAAPPSLLLAFPARLAGRPLLLEPTVSFPAQRS